MLAFEKTKRALSPTELPGDMANIYYSAGSLRKQKHFTGDLDLQPKSELGLQRFSC